MAGVQVRIQDSSGGGRVMPKRHANENLRTTFEGSGRFAGIGIDEEDYSEESFPDRNPWRYKQGAWWSPKRKIEPESVTVYKLSAEELKKYQD